MLYYVIQFLVITTITYFLYHYFFIKKNVNKKTKPIEFSYLEKRYKIKLNKINLIKLGKTVALVNSVVIALTVVVIDLVGNLILQLAIGFSVLLVLIIVAYYFIGLYYQKKGMTKDV